MANGIFVKLDDVLNLFSTESDIISLKEKISELPAIIIAEYEEEDDTK